MQSEINKRLTNSSRIRCKPLIALNNVVNSRRIGEYCLKLKQHRHYMVGHKTCQIYFYDNFGKRTASGTQVTQCVDRHACIYCTCAHNCRLNSDYAYRQHGRSWLSPYKCIFSTLWSNGFKYHHLFISINMHFYCCTVPDKMCSVSSWSWFYGN